jgi:hypothetical protein
VAPFLTWKGGKRSRNVASEESDTEKITIGNITKTALKSGICLVTDCSG